jgi:hypothetical protein
MKSLVLRGSWLVLVACGGPGPAVTSPDDADVARASPTATDEPAAPDAPVPHDAPAPTVTPERAPVRGAPTATQRTPQRRDGADVRADEGKKAEYRREDWPHWIDADGDCQDTRTEVLIAEAEPGSIVFTDARECKIAAGRWRCPYTGRVITDPHELDVDHLVPLAHAHAAGGNGWSRARRTAYANDLGDERHLVAVVAGANRSKGARSIVTWLPPAAAARCEYVDAWRAITARWSLVATSIEAKTAEAYAADCREGRTPQLAGAAESARPAESVRPAESTSDAEAVAPAELRGTCCKVCSAGKPCGDGCIARDKACHKPPGCAC